jgi:hypothetical protein
MRSYPSRWGIFRGLNSIDRCEVWEWLEKYGISNLTLKSATVKGLYDLAFSFADGDPSKPDIAARVGLRGALRMMFSRFGRFHPSSSLIPNDIG